jgi:hypothetical protein
MVAAGVVVAAGQPGPAATVTVAPSGDGTTAAAAHGWGRVRSGDEFDYTGPADPAKWLVYDSAGHGGNGLRSPAQVTVNGSRLVIDGTADGTTGGMSAKFANQKYGRWETRMAVPVGDNEYHGVSILWPDSGNWPCDGEINYAENLGDRTVMKFFHHYSCSNQQTQVSKAVDATQFHNYAVDWSPAGIVGYIDGVQWFSDTDPAHQPPGSMHQTLQLDWFPDATADGTAQMQVDWVRVYAAAGGTPPPAPTTGSVTIAAVGDMNGVRTTSTTSASGKNAASIGDALAAGEVESFIGIGDFQYDTAYCADYVNYWNKLWNRVKEHTYWVSAPNHDWQPGRNEDLDNFMNGQCPGDTSKSRINAVRGFISNGRPYSFDKGNWHFAMLSSALWRYDEAEAQRVTTWLDRDLAAAKAAGKYLAVVYHEPYYTSNTASHTRASDHKPWIDVMDKHDVRLTLSGSQHNYERSCPVNKADRCVAAGMTAFQVSTGGVGLRAFTSSPAYITKRFSDTYGWLKLTLNADGSFSWKYVPVSGEMQTDSGTRAAP